MRRGHNEADVTAHQVDKVLITTRPADSQIRVYVMLPCQPSSLERLSASQAP